MAKTVDITADMAGRIAADLVRARKWHAGRGKSLAKLLELATMAECADRWNTSPASLTDDEIKNSNTPEAQAAAAARMRA